MGLKSKLSWLVGLLGVISLSYASPVTAKEQVSTTINYVNKKKHNIDLKCKKVVKVSTNDFSFYACKRDITPRLISRMEYVAAVKKHVKEKLGLKQTTNYQIYKNGKDEKPTTLYRLYVTPQFELPQEWERDHYVDAVKNKIRSCKVKGPTIFVSSADKLVDESIVCMMEGFDVFRISYSDFGGGSNLGPRFFQKPIAEQTSTIIHEDWHVTVDEIGYDASVDESLASLIGDVTTIDFTGSYFGKDSKEYKEAKENLKLWLEYSKHTAEQNDKLLELYATNMSVQEKIDKKEKIIAASRYGRNNAKLWAKLPYTRNFSLVYLVHKAHPDLEELMEILIKTPKKEREAIQYLQRYVIPEGYNEASAAKLFLEF